VRAQVPGQLAAVELEDRRAARVPLVAPEPARAPPPLALAASSEPPPPHPSALRRFWWLVPVGAAILGGVAVGLYFALRTSCATASYGCIDAMGAGR
jgi:hypothetical protein